MCDKEMKKDMEPNSTMENVVDLSQFTTKDLFKNIGKRFLVLPAKMIGMNGMVMAISTWALHKHLIDGWIWMTSMILVLFGMKGLNAVKEILKIGRGGDSYGN